METNTPRTDSIKIMVANFDMGESIPYKHAIELCGTLEREINQLRTVAGELSRELSRLDHTCHFHDPNKCERCRALAKFRALTK